MKHRAPGGKRRFQPARWPLREAIALALSVGAAAPRVVVAASALAVSAPGTLDSRPPVVAWLAPAAGDSFRAAAVETLRWSVLEDSAAGAPALRLALLDGADEVWADSLTVWSTGETTYLWTVPQLHVAAARLVVSVRDAFGWAGADTSGAFTVSNTSTDLTSPQAPARDTVGPAVPNPFNPSTTVHFALASPARVRLCIHDLAGRRVALLRDGALAAGTHTAVWDGRDASGRACPSGPYFARLSVAGERDAALVTRLTLVK